MVDPIGAAISQTYAVNRPRADVAGQASASAPMDVVSISDEAVRRYAAGVTDAGAAAQAGQDAATADASPWTLPGGQTHAERTLKNGHTEIVDIDGGTLTVREYDGDRLVKSVDGTMVDDRAVLDTTYYDKSGGASQVIHAELARLETKNGWSGAVMTRSVQWFEDGRTVRTLSDEMFLRSRNLGTATVSGGDFSRMTKAMDGNSDGLVRLLTGEEHSLGYHADIREFHDNGQLARNLVIDQSGGFTQESNRHSVEVGGLGPMSTHELHHDLRLNVTAQDYDRDGKLLREASVSDAHEDGVGGKDGKQVQSANVAWYKDGEVVKRGSGTFRLEETPGRGLMQRPGILDLLGLKPEEYLTPEPQEAGELLGTKLPDSSGGAEFFLEGPARSMAKGRYGSASDMAEYGHRDQPFSVDWTTELYEEGDVVMRKRDSQRAVDAPGRGLDDRLPFRTVGGLSDGDRPVVLERTGHVTEIIDNGRTVARESLEAREIIQPDEDGPDTLLTLADYDRLDGDGEDGVNVVYKGGIAEADPDARAGLRGLGAELDLTLDGVYDMYRSLRTGRDRTDPGSGFRFNGFS